MNSFLRNFSPYRSLFLNHFEKAIKNVVEMASILSQAVNTLNYRFNEEIVNQIRKRENLGDNITHKIYLSLDKVIFTPLDREDIHALAACLDDVADTINEAGCRMFMYNIDHASPETRKMAEIILKAANEIEKAIMLLYSPQKNQDFPQLHRQIKNYEKQSGLIYNAGVAKLFSDEKDPISLLKHREILQSLVSAVVKCKKVSDILNNVLFNS